MNNAELDFFIQTWGTALGIFIVAFFLANLYGKTPVARHKWFVISALALAIYAVLTSWIWIYYANFFICLPFFIVSVILAYLGYRVFSKSKLLKITWWLQGAALFIAFTSFVLLLLFDS